MSLSNAEIAEELLRLAHLLADQKGNPFKIKAYRRAAKTIQTVGDSFDELVRSGADLTEYPGIGKAIGGAIQEIVQTGTLRQVEALRSQASPERVAISEHPRLDAKRVLRIYKKLNIASIGELKEKLENGELAAKMGVRTEQHVREALTEATLVRLYDADRVVPAVEDFLLRKCGVVRAQAAGDYRRRKEVVAEIAFLIETDDLPAVLSRMESYGGKTTLISASKDGGMFKLPSGAVLEIRRAHKRKWGVALITATGSNDHLRALAAHGCQLEKADTSKASYPTEADVYRACGLSFIDPEIREGHGEVELAAHAKLPALVSVADIRGDLHAHSTSSDGKNTIEQMAAAARKKGYDYIGMSDHSQSLKIAGGLTEEELWNQIRAIDRLNARLEGIRVLKSSEVDILADGSLDYPDVLLKELDYTVCSIHSKFVLGKAAQTERILRAMDNRYFTILGHATGRLLLKRPGYEIDIDRVVEHARKTGCFFEVNSSPDRLDLSAENARLAGAAGVKIAVNTDAHSIRELDLMEYGIGQARRAGLPRQSILNCLSWPDLQHTIKR
jgi:DNA polymerase (family 10)